MLDGGGLVDSHVTKREGMRHMLWRREVKSGTYEGYGRPFIALDFRPDHRQPHTIASDSNGGEGGMEELSGLHRTVE